VEDPCGSLRWHYAGAVGHAVLHPLTDVLQVLTNENGGIAMLSSLGGPMDVKSFYISNPNKVMHLDVRSADDCQYYRRGVSPSRFQCCINIDSCVKCKPLVACCVLAEHATDGDGHHGPAAEQPSGH
jgi:hypothetical protein